MRVNDEWQDYKILATGNGEKLEKWGNIVLLRPDPQVIWPARIDLKKHNMLSAYYERHTTGGGEWHNIKKMSEQWIVGWRDLKFLIKPMGFKHTGLFPEQATNWSRMIELIKNAGRDIKVLNLFAYTGGATIACASAGASVTHVDAAKGMVDRCKENAKLSKIPEDKIRYIVDDCKKFLEKEIRRGNHYDAIIMDPPSYGRGPNGEVWKLEDCLYDFVMLCKQVLSSTPLFVLINSYTTGLQPCVLNNISMLVFSNFKMQIDSYEVGLNTDEKIILPCGCSCFVNFS